MKPTFYYTLEMNLKLRHEREASYIFSNGLQGAATRQTVRLLIL